MLIPNDNGTFTAGPFDAVFVLKHVETGRLHVAFFEETPVPGPVPIIEETMTVRLRSKMHHTAGAASTEELDQHVAAFRARVLLPDCNVFLDPIDWNGDLGLSMIRSNWRSEAA